MASACACASARTASALALACVTTISACTFSRARFCCSLCTSTSACMRCSTELDVVGRERDVLDLHALDGEHRIVGDRLGQGLRGVGIELAAGADGARGGVLAEHDLHLLVDMRGDRAVDRGLLVAAEARIHLRHLVGRDVERDRDLEIGRLLVGRIGLHLRPGEGVGLHVDLGDGVDPRPFEMQAGLHDLDEGAVAQQDAALGLVDGVPAPEHDGEAKDRQKADDDGIAQVLAAHDLSLSVSMF